MFYLKHVHPSHSSGEYVLVQTIQVSTPFFRWNQLRIDLVSCYMLHVTCYMWSVMCCMWLVTCKSFIIYWETGDQELCSWFFLYLFIFLQYNLWISVTICPGKLDVCYHLSIYDQTSHVNQLVPTRIPPSLSWTVHLISSRGLCRCGKHPPLEIHFRLLIQFHHERDPFLIFYQSLWSPGVGSRQPRLISGISI